MQCNYTEAIIFLKAYDLNRQRRTVWKMHVTCKVKTCICIINAMYILIFACFSFLLTSSCCFLVCFIYAFLTLVCNEGKNKKIPVSKAKEKGRDQRAQEKLVLGREEVRMRPESRGQVSKRKEANTARKTLWILDRSKCNIVACVVNVLA